MSEQRIAYVTDVTEGAGSPHRKAVGGKCHAPRIHCTSLKRPGKILSLRSAVASHRP
ncbi:hypothetical protein FF011L_44780 [Roseimaritima multifibrata]|uniref:Uncharacterized protein n=1 Tax=Roseimaritima multifibrata TaxID=1930274 RepID=A0A517MF94_9BACT|nr:hypothetical protein FF011L_23270 [Roseimaritima multifibrata]QDS93559.1 hypothetical protein FF011L_23290 [Roseimaritima multifibrata]QDS95678.1 hypothetical protein FF011L_44780 [Roseimaritima multifibrata]